MLDIGTGSGCAGDSRSSSWRGQRGRIDLDPDAITNARENLELNAIPDGVTFVESDIQSHASDASVAYDLILANF